MAQDRPIGNMKFGVGFDGLDESLNTLDKLNRAIKQTESAMKTNISTMDKGNKTAADYARVEADLTRAYELQAKKIALLEKRKEEQIKAHGAESAAVARTVDQINKASTKYNQYNKEIDKNKQAHIIASSGVDKYSKALSENEKQMKQEVSALKSSGDKLGAYKAQKKGLETQERLTTKAIAAQETVVKELTKEYGYNSSQVQEAQSKLDSYKRQQTITSKQIEGTNKSIKEGSSSFKGLNDEMSKSEGASTKATKSLGKVTSGLGSMVSSIGKVVGKVGLGALLTIGNKAFNAVSSNVDSAIKRIDTLKNSTRAFENMGFSADNTAKAMKNISKAIEGLPTALDDSVKNVQLLAASTGDLDLSVDLYKALNDAIIGFGGDANMANNAIVQLSQSFSNGKVDAQTWNSMINSGLGPTLNALAKQMGITTGELKNGLSEGKISVKDFQEGLIKLDQEGGGGLKSLETIVKDSTKGIGTSLENAKTAMVRGTAALIESADQVLANMNLPTIAEMISNSGKKVEDIMKAVASGLPELATNFAWVGDVFGQIGELSSAALGKFGDFVTGIKDGVSGLIEYITNVWSGTATNGDDYILAQLGFDYETIWALDDFITQVKEKGEVLTQYIKGFWQLFTGDEATQMQGYSLLRSLGMSQEDIEALETAKENIKTAFDSVKEVIKKLLEEGLDKMIQAWKDLVKIWEDDIAPDLLPLFQQFSGWLGRITGDLSVITGALDNFGGSSQSNSNVVIDAFGLMWEGIKLKLALIMSTVETAMIIISSTIKIWSKIFKGDWGGAWEEIKNMYDRISNSIKENLKNTFLGDMINSIEQWNTKTTAAFTGWISDISTKFSTWVTKMKNWFQNLPGELADKFRSGGSKVADAFKSVFNGALKAIGKPVNAIIHGASWVLENLGAEPLTEWEVPQYAKGTPAGGHPINGPMMVNDGRGAEMIIRPNGQAYIPQGKNVVLNEGKGTHVLTAEETANVMGSKVPKYRYKKGTNFFGNMWNSVKNVAGNVGNTLKNVVGDVWDFISDPGALARKVLGGLDVLGGLTKYPLEVGKGILSKATSALTEKITGLFSSGNLDTSIGTNGVYKYLADVAKSVMKKFPGFMVTSGYREGDPYSHGKRNAIDIALPGVTGGSPRYTEAANYAFDKFASKIGYVITNGKVRDRSGQSGQPATGAWETWPAGDHYDHVHLNGIKDPQNTQISGDSLGGSGVDRWRGIATQALRMTGQYSASNLNALLNQMRTESNGNPKAINLWDPNAMKGTPSKGLLQVIDPTFRQYAMPGYNSNIYDPLSNILASIRYALATYGSLTNAYRGVGYENGGIITKQHMAMVGEGNKEEVVIPLTGSGLKRSRAMQLLAYANEKLGKNNDPITSPSTNATNVSDMAQLIALMQEQNQLLMGILAKDTSIEIDGIKLNSKLNTIRQTQERNNRRNLGLI
jgi:tape measure domain-containing protein|nr:MAG TPA: tail tape measure [Caudoviricetes sp.]